MEEGIRVVCANCGRKFLVSEDLAGRSTTCPQCERQVAVPHPQDQQDERPRLQVRRGTPIAGGKACPSCGAAMAGDAVICVHCGFDTRTGSSWQGRPANKNTVGLALAVIGVAIVLGWVHLWLKARRESGPIGESPVVPSPAPTVVPSAEREPAPEAGAAPVATQTEVVAIAPTGEAFATAMVTNAPMATPPTPSVSRKDLEKQLIQTLNARYPLYARGSQAVLRQSNGLVHRGEVIALGTNSVTLKTELGIQEIDFAVLDKESRLRCDVRTRERLVQRRVEQMLSSQMASP